MAYYRFSNTTRELLEISDFPLSPGDDEAVSEISSLTKRDLEGYQWEPSSCSFSLQPKRLLTKKEFLKRITPTEYATIKAATQANAVVDYYWQLFMVAEYIDLNDHDVMTGLGALEQMGLLATGRSTEILS